jgi:spectinomycin phosphotransferase
VTAVAALAARVAEIKDEPAEISPDLVAGILNKHWGFAAMEVAYAPVGFGSHHWIASEGAGPRWFVTADRLDRDNQVSIEAALGSAKELADDGYEFVVAPLPDRAGRLVREVPPGWTPYLAGRHSSQTSTCHGPAGRTPSSPGCDWPAHWITFTPGSRATTRWSARRRPRTIPGW